MNTAAHSNLVYALVGNNPEHMHRYQTSALFRANIVSLAQILPMWVDGIAAKADQENERYERDVLAAMTAPLEPAIFTEDQISEMFGGKRP